MSYLRTNRNTNAFTKNYDLKVSNILANIYKKVTIAGGPGVANKDAGVQSPIFATRFSSF